MEKTKTDWRQNKGQNRPGQGAGQRDEGGKNSDRLQNRGRERKRAREGE